MLHFSMLISTKNQLEIIGNVKIVLVHKQMIYGKFIVSPEDRPSMERASKVKKKFRFPAVTTTILLAVAVQFFATFLVRQPGIFKMNPQFSQTLWRTEQRWQHCSHPPSLPLEMAGVNLL